MFDELEKAQHKPREELDDLHKNQSWFETGCAIVVGLMFSGFVVLVAWGLSRLQL